MIDDTRYTEEYVEQLENELKALRSSHNELTNELHGLYGSKAYRAGNLARVAYRDPVRVAKKVARIVKVTKRLSPKALKYFRAATPHNSAIINEAYTQWQNDFEPSAKELERQIAHSKTLPKQPIFSIITPVFKPPKDVLIELIESVLNQTYQNFELCLGEFSGEQTTREVLTAYAKKDARIKVKFFDDNLGISENSDKCLTLATGDYISLLDHDDTLSPDALYENAVMINDKDYDFIYSDKDKIDEAGNRFDPMFKPNWSPELMLTANYLTHFNVFKKSILDKIGGWDKATDGAQDWDLFFRLIAESTHIGHIPKILYHWRVIATSTAMSISTKPYALVGQKRAIIKYAESLNIMPPIVHHTKEGALSLEWGKQTDGKSVECIIIADEEKIILANKLAKKMAKHRSLPSENIKVYLANKPAHNLGEMIEKGRQSADILLIVDARVSGFNRSTWLDELAGWLTVPGVGIVSPQTYSKFGVFLEAGRIIGLGTGATPLFAGETYIPGVFGYREWSRNVSLPSMFCLAINTSSIPPKAVTQPGIQGIRELSLKIALNDSRTVVTPFDFIVLDASGIYEPAMSPVNKKLIKRLIPSLNDPYFSANLSVEKKYPMFLTAQEAPGRKQVLEGLLDTPIEYDSTRSASTELHHFREEVAITGYKREAYIVSGLMDYTPEDLRKSRRITDSSTELKKIESALWIIPNFTTLYAGLKNIFALAAELSKSDQTRHTFYMTTLDDVDNVRDLVAATFPALANATFINAPEYDKLKNSHVTFTIGVCTLWTTAYQLLLNNNVQRKLYIIQDDERGFYPRGSMYALADATYDFGFWGIAGTAALADWYETRQGQKGNTMILGSDLELSSYLKYSAVSAKKVVNSRPRILFYARPDAPRNSFELGIRALSKFASDNNGNADIVLAGADFDLSQYEGVHGSIKTAGKVPYSQLAEFYASFDAALFLMFSEHPGVFALEMMASSVPVVVNKHRNSSWEELYSNGKTCVTSDATPSAIAEVLQEVVTNQKLRNTLIANGRQLAQKRNNISYSAHAKHVIESVKRKVK